MNEQWIYQQHQQYFGVVAAGLEKLAGDELSQLGATEIRPGYRGLHFEADVKTLYAILYASRLLTRVLAPLCKFDCHSPKYLYRRAAEIDWSSFIAEQDTFAIQAITSHSAIRHSRYAALTLKDAIVDQFRDKTGRRPSVDPRNPDRAIHLHIERNRATISLDISGGSMHRRGYRAVSVEAPMQETMAAALIAVSGWSAERPFLDPFCGSGTLLCEAWMRACQIPAGFLRKQSGAATLPDYDDALCLKVRQELNGRIQVPKHVHIEGQDIDFEAVAAAQRNLAVLPEGDRVQVKQADALKLKLSTATEIVTNPPYGLRLQDRSGAGSLLKRFGDTLKQHCAGSRVTIYYGEPAMSKELGLRPTKKHAISHGGLDGLACTYELFEGLGNRRGKPAN